MRAITTKGFIFSKQLQVSEKSQPAIGANDVLVKVAAISVNPKDLKLNTQVGRFIPKLGSWRPAIFGDDLSGRVVATGSKVTQFKVGDEVYGMDMHFRTAAAADFARISQKRIAIKPKNLSHQEAALVPLAALTAYQAFLAAKLKASQKVLVIGASGGVGTFAVQIAKALGAEVTGVCSGSNVELVKSLGADHVIDYTKQNFLDSQAQFDMVYDVISQHTPRSCYPILKKGGYFISTGSAIALLGIALEKVLPAGGRKSLFLTVYSSTKHLDVLRAMIESGKLKPVMDSEFSLENINSAYDRSKSGRARGKISITLE